MKGDDYEGLPQRFADVPHADRIGWTPNDIAPITPEGLAAVGDQSVAAGAANGQFPTHHLAAVPPTTVGSVRGEVTRTCAGEDGVSVDGRTPGIHRALPRIS